MRPGSTSIASRVFNSTPEAVEDELVFEALSVAVTAASQFCDGNVEEASVAWAKNSMLAVHEMVLDESVKLQLELAT